MGHIPNAKKGLQALTSMNEDILAELATQSDIAMAKQQDEREASFAAIKERHANELKAAKRNHKQRAKKIKDRMAEFENMPPIQLAEMFKNGVPEGTVSLPFSNRPMLFADLGQSESRFMHHGRQSGKSLMIEELMRHYRVSLKGGRTRAVPIVEPKMQLIPRYRLPSEFGI